jgi:hypothetical protein
MTTPPPSEPTVFESPGPAGSAIATTAPSTVPTRTPTTAPTAAPTKKPSGTGPAVRFAVTGLVDQPNVCYQGVDCAGYPSAAYPRQIAKITALDANGKVATGYKGTVTFEHPIMHGTPPGMANMKLTKGVGYVPVLVPRLLAWVGADPLKNACPNDELNAGVVLTVMDTVDPSIFGCQRIPGGDLTIVLSSKYLEESSADCPTGCYTDPTEQITIDTNIADVTSLTTSVDFTDLNASLVITGATLNENYFTQELDVGTMLVAGSSIPAGLLDACAQCTTGTNYLTTSASSMANSDVTLGIGQIRVFGNYRMTLSDVEVLGPVTVFINGVNSTECFAESQLQTIVSIQDC